MEKVYNIFIAFVMLVVALSCTRQEEPCPPADSEDVFYASISGEDVTKTLIDGMKIKWEDSDCILINGAEYEAAVVSSDPTQATCTLVSGVPTKDGDLNKAIFPSSLYHATPSPHYELPTEFEYTGDRYQIPMYAESTTRNLKFHSMFATIKICLPDSYVVKRLTVSADTYINGEFTINTSYLGYINYVQAEIVDGSDKNKMTIVNFNPAIFGGDIYIPVPSDWYKGKNLKFTITCNDDVTFDMTTNQSSYITIYAGTLYTFDFRRDGYFATIKDKQIGYDTIW